MYCPKGSHDSPRIKPGEKDWGIEDRRVLLNLVHGKSNEGDPIVWEYWKCEVCNEEWKSHLSYYALVTDFERSQIYYNDAIKKWNLKGIE